MYILCRYKKSWLIRERLVRAIKTGKEGEGGNGCNLEAVAHVRMGDSEVMLAPSVGREAQ